MNLSAFRAYDIRGIYPDEINEDLAYLIGRAVVRYCSAKTIVVGCDARTSSPSLKKKLIEGINCEGADVFDIGLCTTPMTNFAVQNYNYDAGIMISASHNPPQYNAFKIIKPGILQVGEDEGLLDIKALVKKGFQSCPSKGTVTEKEVLSDYISHLLKFSEGISGLKVVADYGNGVGAVSAAPTFARLDIETINMYEKPDGTFPNHPANPHDVKNFDELKEKVVSEGADLGIFFDGDADRALFVDEKGNIVPTDLLVAVLSKVELAKGKKGMIYYDLRFSKSFPKIIKEADGETKMMGTGNPPMKKALKEEGGILAAEFSGHMMFSENWGIDDGLFSCLKVLSLLSEKKKPLSEIIEPLKIVEGSPEISLEAKNPDTVYDRVKDTFPHGVVNEIDGVYIDFPDGFVLVRKSKGEPNLFRVRAEAKTKDELKKRLDKVLNIVKS